MADISIILVSHDKAAYVKEAVQSVLDQTYQNWEMVLVDSGVLLKQGFFDYLKDARVKVLPSGETPELARTKNMASWCFNNVLNSGKLSGELVMYLCDDDLLYKEAFETFWNYYVGHKREPQAMYSSQDIGLVDLEGRTRIIGKRIADRPGGRLCKGRKMDCQVDNLQFCHTRAILEKVGQVHHTNRYHSEDKRDAYHADGIFMEQVGALTKIHNINKVLSMNRRTVASANLDYSESRIGRFRILVKEKVKGLRRKLAPGRR
jgi:hypothetical protein